MTTFTEGTWPMYLTQSNSFLYPLVQPSYCSWTLSHLQKMLFLLSIFCFALCLYFEFLWWETIWHLSSCLCFISLYMFSRYIHFLPMTQVYHSLQQSNIPSCINLIFFFSIHLWMDIQSASMVQLLQTVIWQTWVCMDCWLLFPGVWIKVPLLRLLSSSVFSLLLLLTLHVFLWWKLNPWTSESMQLAELLLAFFISWKWYCEKPKLATENPLITISLLFNFRS